MRRFALTIALSALGVAFAATTPLLAHDGWGPGYGGGYGGYYGNGGHDFVPHWHTTRTPFGAYQWYGNGRHDYVPHGHTYTPYSYRGHSFSPWGYTESYYPRYPRYYGHW